MSRRFVLLLASISILLVFIAGIMKPNSPVIDDEELIGEWENSARESVEVLYWDDQKTRIIVNGFEQLNFTGPYTVLSPTHLRIQDVNVRAPHELHLKWAAGRLDLYIFDAETETVHPEFQFRFSQFHGDGSFDLPELPSPSGLGGLNEHGLVMVRALARNDRESWNEWVKYPGDR